MVPTPIKHGTNSSLRVISFQKVIKQLNGKSFAMGWLSELSVVSKVSRESA